MQPVDCRDSWLPAAGCGLPCGVQAQGLSASQRTCQNVGRTLLVHFLFFSFFLRRFKHLLGFDGGKQKVLTKDLISQHVTFFP